MGTSLIGILLIYNLPLTKKTRKYQGYSYQLTNTLTGIPSFTIIIVGFSPLSVFKTNVQSNIDFTETYKNINFNFLRSHFKHTRVSTRLHQ